MKDKIFGGKHLLYGALAHFHGHSKVRYVAQRLQESREHMGQGENCGLASVILASWGNDRSAVNAGCYY